MSPYRTIVAPSGFTTKTARSTRYVLARIASPSVCADCGKAAFPTAHAPNGRYAHVRDAGLSCTGPSALIALAKVLVISGTSNLDTLRANSRALHNKGDHDHFGYDLTDGIPVAL